MNVPILPINMYLTESVGDPSDPKEVMKGYGEYLAEKKWPSWVSDIDDTYMQRVCAILLENQLQYQNLMKATSRNTLFLENTTTAGISTYSQAAFPVVRGLIPNLVAADLVSIQPMTGPTSLVFYLKITAGTKKGKTAVGTELTETLDENYSSELIEGESHNLDVGSATVQTFQLEFYPVRRGTLSIKIADTDTEYVVTDNGNGGLVASTNPSSGLTLTAAGSTINYDSGALSIQHDGTITGVTADVPIEVDYRYDMEQNSNIPEVDINVTSSPVVARARKLRARYGFEAAQNLQSVHGLDAGTEISTWVTQELRHEIDREVINSVRNVASAGMVNNFDRTPTAGLGLDEHLRGFKQYLNDGGNLIFDATKRAQGNWIVGGTEVGTVLETLPGFVASGMADQHGVVNIGTIDGRWNCFKDPYPAPGDRGNYTIGHKGSNFMETGYILAFYIPLYTTPEITLDDFISRRGMATLYAKKSVDGRFYAKGKVTRTGS
jgi:hypothetical protein